MWTICKIHQDLKRNLIDVDDHTIIGVGEDGLYNFKETQLIAPTIKAVQELKIKFTDDMESLKLEVQYLRGKIKQLEEMVT